MTADINEKLDLILNSIKILTTRMEEFGTRLDNVEAKFKRKFKIIDDELASKADLSELEIMRKINKELERSKEEQERTAVMIKSYEKRLYWVSVLRTLCQFNLSIIIDFRNIRFIETLNF